MAVGAVKYRPHPVIGDHSPEGARVGGADGFSFVQDRRRTTDQRRVHDVGVANDPTDIGCRPPHVARIHPVDVPKGPGHRHGVTAVVAHDALGLSRRAGGVQDVERIGRRHRDGIDRRRRRVRGIPIDIALTHLGRRLRSLKNDHPLRLMRAHLDRRIDQRLVLHDSRGLDSATGGHDDRRMRVVDPRAQLRRGESSEDDRMNRPDSCTREHGHHRLRNHRHVDDNPVARAHPQIPQHSRETRGCLEQIVVRPSFAGAGNGAVVDDRRPRTVPGRNVTVDRVDARVQPAVWKPSVERRRRLIQDLRGLDIPLDRARCFAPEPLGIVQAAAIRLGVGAHGR